MGGKRRAGRVSGGRARAARGDQQPQIGPGAPPAMANPITSAALYVRDRNRARDWYVSTLGWKVLDDDGEHWVVVGEKKGAGLHLCEKGKRLPKGDVGESGLLIVPTDFAKTVRALKKAKVKWATPPTKRPWGSIARFTDPDGNILWLSTAA